MITFLIFDSFLVCDLFLVIDYYSQFNTAISTSSTLHIYHIKMVLKGISHEQFTYRLYIPIGSKFFGQF